MELALQTLLFVNFSTCGSQRAPACVQRSKSGSKFKPVRVNYGTFRTFLCKINFLTQSHSSSTLRETRLFRLLLLLAFFLSAVPLESIKMQQPQLLREPLSIFKSLLILITLQLQAIPILALSPCRNFCGDIPIKYPFGLDDGCGAPQFRHMFNCTNDLFFQTPSGAYKVQSIDYDKKSMVIYDPAMSTCSILQPHHDFIMTDVQSAIIPPSQDTVFALLNCSIDSPVLNHYKYLCFNFSGHSCDELYGSCNAFRVFHLLTNSSPPCCFTSYNTVKFMSMNILDCTHYTSLFNIDNLKGVAPLDWVYGIKLSFSVPDTGCETCRKSGGACGFDTDTEALLCLCSISTNSTQECAAGSIIASGESNAPRMLYQLALFLGSFLHMVTRLI